MTSFSLRALLPVLVGVSSACHHRSASTTGAPPPSQPTASPNAVVTSEDLAKAPGQSVEQVLMGRFPGVDVTRTSDGGFAVRIRGGSSIRGGNTPLYVLDGVVNRSGPQRIPHRGQSQRIESIEVLKEPAETALYGMRGSNGVIVIKDKRPDHP